MSETVKQTDQALKKSWLKGLKSEFKKIIWPDKESLMKQTIAVSIVSVVVGAIIAVLDLIIQFGLKFIIG